MAIQEEYAEVERDLGKSVDDLTRADLIVELRTGFADIHSKIDHDRQLTAARMDALAEKVDKNTLKTEELEKTVNAGITSVRVLKWVGASALAIWGAATAWFKVFPPHN